MAPTKKQQDTAKKPQDGADKPQDTADKPQDAEKKEEDRLLVTRAILEEVKRYIGPSLGRTDEQVLARLRQMAGRNIELVETLPEDDDVVVICSPEPVVPGSRMGKCSKCGVTVYHSRSVSAAAKKICTRCGPRLGH